MLTYGKGPIINVTPLRDNEEGLFKPNEKSNILNINKNTVNWLESTEGIETDVALFIVGVTILHEFAHYGDDLSGNPDKDREDGDVFEKLAYGKKVNRIDAWIMVSKYIHKFDKNKSNNNKNEQETKEKDGEVH